MRASLMLAVAALSTSAAHAESLTYDQAIRGAVANAPGAAAGRAGVTAAQAEAGAAGSLPDPRLSIGIDNYPISGPPAFSLSRDDMTMGRVGFQQDLPNLAKRHAAQAQARAAIVTAQASQEIKLRQIRLGAGQAWIDLAYAGRRLAAIDAIIRSLRALPPAARTAVAAGTSRPAQSLGIDQAIAGLEDRRDELVAWHGLALPARISGYERCVDRGVFSADQPCTDAVSDRALEQDPEHAGVAKAAMPVLAERRVVRNPICWRETTEPAVGQIVAQLLAQAPLGRDRVDAANQSHADQQFGIDRWSPSCAVMPSQCLPQLARVETSINATQQVVCGQHGFYGAAGRPFPPTATGWSHHGGAPLGRGETKEQPGMSGIFQQARPVLTLSQSIDYGNLPLLD